MYGFTATIDMMRDTFYEVAIDQNLGFEEGSEEYEEEFDAWLEQEIVDCAITIV